MDRLGVYWHGWEQGRSERPSTCPCASWCLRYRSLQATRYIRYPKTQPMHLSTLLRSAACLLTGCSLIGARAQCGEQVSHLSGTQNVGLAQVTVTSTGTVDTNDSYCLQTFPYFIGYSYGTGTSATGGYTFQFNPPVDSAMLNVSGTSQTNADIEEVWLYVNGAHYAIPEPGMPQSCDAMAVLTAEGNIAACANCSVSGWGGTVIPGPINTLTVLDTLLCGSAGGSIFSLFICAQHGNGWPDAAGMQPGYPYPNPAADAVSVRLSGVNAADVSLFDASGRCVTTGTNASANTVRMSTAALPDGIYTMRVRQGDALTVHRVVVAR